MQSDPTARHESPEEHAEHRREELEGEYPDGVGPEQQTIESMKYGVIILAISGIAAIFLVLWAFGGLAAAIVAALLVAMFAVIGVAPAWMAGLLRHRDEEEIRHRMEEEDAATEQARGSPQGDRDAASDRPAQQ